MAEPYQRDIWWAELGAPQGSEAAFVRPVLVIQCDSINLGRLRTLMVAPLTSSPAARDIPWNLALAAGSTGLDRDSSVQTHLITTINRDQLIERVGQITARQLDQLFRCLDITLGR